MNGLGDKHAELGEVLVIADHRLLVFERIVFPGFSLTRRIDVDEVYVGAVVEFAPAQLSHSENGEFAFLPVAVGVLVIGRSVLLFAFGNSSFDLTVCTEMLKINSLNNHYPLLLVFIYSAFLCSFQSYNDHAARGSESLFPV